MQKHIVILPGDGIGPEITDGAVAVLKTVAQKFDHTFDFTYLPIGLSALDAAIADATARWECTASELEAFLEAYNALREE